MQFTATYSPEDNKLRLYASSRLDKELYERVRAAGFIWAPKQELFVAPMWTPAREDLLMELCGEIGDEDKTLVERQEERAERFEEYSEKRADDADRAHQAVASIADNIPMGQPILVGHHSERRARKDAERIQNGMRKAVKMWETSKYWTSRAAGAIRHAKYKEVPAVRARRIKGIEADERRCLKSKNVAMGFLDMWCKPDLTREKAMAIANYDHLRLPDGDPRGWSVWSALEKDALTVEDAKAIAVGVHTRNIEINDRWLAHLGNRLTYERAMLAESGYVAPPKKKSAKAELPLLNIKGAVAYRNPYHHGEIVRGNTVSMTKAEYAAIHSDYKGTRISECGTHRLRTAMRRHELVMVFLSDSKEHERPTDDEKDVKAMEEKAAAERMLAARVPRVRQQKPPDERDEKFKALKEAAKKGVTVVSAPQLFPTPPDVAQRMVELADIKPGQRILEPSAGTGRILDAIGTNRGTQPVLAVEINESLGNALRTKYPLHSVKVADFLKCNGDLGTFDRILMNPPFKNASDVEHIKHAGHFLRCGGKIVAICARGPRQEDKLRPIADDWIDLPDDTFAEEGTSVRTAIVVINAEHDEHVEDNQGNCHWCGTVMTEGGLKR